MSYNICFSHKSDFGVVEFKHSEKSSKKKEKALIEIKTTKTALNVIIKAKEKNKEAKVTIEKTAGKPKEITVECSKKIKHEKHKLEKDANKFYYMLKKSWEGYREKAVISQSDFEEIIVDLFTSM